MPIDLTHPTVEQLSIGMGGSFELNTPALSQSPHRSHIAGDLKSGHRPDIDGLRAVAVLGVVVYHLAVVLPGSSISSLSGGYVGVDVFFVISGYLITQIIAGQLDRGVFSLSAFYKRRILRIVPAFAAVTVVTWVYAFIFWFPSELVDYSKSLIASLLSASNIYFWWSTNYFTGTGDDKLLLHTWSLGVEEQFYLTWPVALSWLLASRPNRLGMIIGVAMLSSFSLSAIGVYLWPQATFYLVFSRAWELLLGGSLALRLISLPANRLVREGFAGLGLLGILASMTLYGPTTAFPGLAALLPCSGAAAIIAAGRDRHTLVGRALSLRPVAFVGLISYSLYLWHWPVLVLQKAVSLLPGGDAGKTVKVEILVTCFVLAVLSWRFVEQPFRNRVFATKNVFVSSGLCALAFFGVAVLGLSGLPSRFSPDAVRMASYLRYADTPSLMANCQLSGGQRASDTFFSGCLPSDASRPNILLVADSHASHLTAGMRHIFPRTNIVTLTASGCKPNIKASSFATLCGSLVHYLTDRILPAYKFRLILFAGRWERGDLPQVSDFIDFLSARGFKPLLFGPIVQYDQPLPRLVAEALNNRDPTLVGRHRLDLHELDAQMSELASEKHIPYVSLLNVMCPDGACVTLTETGAPLQFDYGHLTADGSRFVAEMLLKSPAFAPLANALDSEDEH